MNARLILIVAMTFSIGVLAALTLRGGGSISTANQTGTVLIGGPFALTNHEGMRVTDEDFRGKYMLVSFGYTFCPDICPAELQLMANTMDELGEKSEKIVPIFVTVDPARDTVEKMRDYVTNFHTKLVGLTGSEEDIKAAAKAYRVYYVKADDAATNPNYLVDHSTFIYLMSPTGQYLSHFPYGITSEEMAAKISALIGG